LILTLTLTLTLTLVFDFDFDFAWVGAVLCSCFLTSAPGCGGEVRKCLAERLGRHPPRPAAVAAVWLTPTGPARVRGPLGGPRAGHVRPLCGPGRSPPGAPRAALSGAWTDVGGHQDQDLPADGDEEVTVTITESEWTSPFTEPPVRSLPNIYGLRLPLPRLHLRADDPVLAPPQRPNDASSSRPDHGRSFVFQGTVQPHPD